MTIHAIALLTVTDPDKLAAYRDRAAEALARHGGAVLQAGAPTALEGSGPQIAAVLAFPDRAAAEAWHADPALAGVHELRRGAGESAVLLL